MVRPLTGMDRNRRALEKLFVSHVADLARHNRRVDVFRDFLGMAATAIQNSTLRSPDLEADYARLIAKYGEKAEVEREFSFLLAITVEALEVECSDFLGHVYMSQEMGIADAGQFFTPSCVARALVKMNLGDIRAGLESSGRAYLTVNDPACGGGVMLIEAAAEFAAQGLDPSLTCCVYGEDIDLTCAHMAYVQLSLLGVPALISHRDSLRMHTWSQWRTPIWWLHGFEWRERARARGAGIPQNDEAAGDDAAAPSPAGEQAAPAAERVSGREAACDLDLGKAVQADLFAS